MLHETRSPADIEAVPLHNAVLCVDCESVTASPHDVCSVCGGHSLLALSRLLGGPLGAYRRDRNPDERVTFHVNIAIALDGIKAEEFSATVGGIAGVLAPALGRQTATFHIDVTPIVENLATCEAEAKAA